MNVTVLRESWGLHPLSWIHRAEARWIAEELRRAGYAVRLENYRSNSVFGVRVLRASPIPARMRNDGYVAQQ